MTWKTGDQMGYLSLLLALAPRNSYTSAVKEAPCAGAQLYCLTHSIAGLYCPTQDFARWDCPAQGIDRWTAQHEACMGGV